MLTMPQVIAKMFIWADLQMQENEGVSLIYEGNVKEQLLKLSLEGLYPDDASAVLELVNDWLRTQGRL